MDQETQGVRGAVNYVKPGMFSAKYSFGYTYFDQVSTIDLDAGNGRHRDTSLPRFDVPADEVPLRESNFFYDNPFRNQSHSHEVQLTSDWDFPVKALVGGFIFEEETRRNLWIDIPSPSQGVILFNQPSRTARSQAIFGEVTWNITPKWELKAGLRYSRDQKINVNGAEAITSRWGARGDRKWIWVPAVFRVARAKPRGCASSQYMWDQYGSGAAWFPRTTNL